MSKLSIVSASILLLLLAGCRSEDNTDVGIQSYGGFGATNIYRVYKTEHNKEECLIIVHGDILEHNCFSDEEARRIISD